MFCSAILQLFFYTTRYVFKHNKVNGLKTKLIVHILLTSVSVYIGNEQNRPIVTLHLWTIFASKANCWNISIIIHQPLKKRNTTLPWLLLPRNVSCLTRRSVTTRRMGSLPWVEIVSTCYWNGLLPIIFYLLNFFIIKLINTHSTLAPFVSSRWKTHSTMLAPPHKCGKGSDPLAASAVTVHRRKTPSG